MAQAHCATSSGFLCSLSHPSITGGGKKGPSSVTSPLFLTKEKVMSITVRNLGGGINCQTRRRLDGQLLPKSGESGQFTCVVRISLVLQQKGPDATRVFIPVVCGHKGPLLVPFATSIIRPSGQRHESNTEPLGVFPV